MSIFDVFQETLVSPVLSDKRFNLEDPNQKIDGKAITEIFGGKPTKTGQIVNEDTALTISAVWACNRAITGPVSALPIKVYQKTAKGRQEISDHPVSKLFSRPNPYQNKTVFMDRYLTHLNLWGNGFAFKSYNKSTGDAAALNLIHPSLIEDVKLEDNRVLTWKIRDPRTNEKIEIDGDEVLHLPGLGDNLIGKSVVQNAREDLALEMSAREYGEDFFKDGGIPQGMISYKAVMDETQRKDAKKNFRSSQKSGKTFVTGAEATYTPFSVPLEDAQFLQTRHFSVPTIARWFGVPPWKLADLKEGSTFRNIEQMGISFLQDTLGPIISKIESEWNNKLFKPGEGGEFYLEFNMDAYLRADSQAKAELFKSYVQNMIKTPNEVRTLNNDVPMEGGDELYAQEQMVPISLLKGLHQNKKPSLNGTGN